MLGISVVELFLANFGFASTSSIVLGSVKSDKFGCASGRKGVVTSRIKIPITRSVPNS